MIYISPSRGANRICFPPINSKYPRPYFCSHKTPREGDGKKGSILQWGRGFHLFDRVDSRQFHPAASPAAPLAPARVQGTARGSWCGSLLPTLPLRLLLSSESPRVLGDPMLKRSKNRRFVCVSKKACQILTPSRFQQCQGSPGHWIVKDTAILFFSNIGSWPFP